MNAVQLRGCGKWHVLVFGGGKTACGLEVPINSVQRHHDLVDSEDRCHAPKCKEARNRAAGRV